MNRIVIALALPVGILMAVLTYTVFVAWQHGGGLCGTWLVSVLPADYCG
jgi:hypothetical protein